MVGAMNESCFPHRTALTEHQLLGTPLPTDVRRHLERCPDCSREAAETESVVRTLHRAGPAAAHPEDRMAPPFGGPSHDLRDRIVREVTRAAPARRRRLPRVALGVAAAALAAVAVVVPVSLSGDQAPVSSTSITLTRHGQMVEKSWGTEVPIVLSGLADGQTYRMMAVNADGKKAPGGSVSGKGPAPVSLRMVTAMPRNTITALLVEDERGHVVSRVPVRPTAT
ncbi:hypothetical protein GCM10011492_07240 [Flexivirga endophytica]|uniref:Zinc-finger domain-containing protein n=2 Tax=Flexivirga endophytica TaxID=1849103 RepID=A0A916WQE5_9MICO|nr:hypothetical protein GCM10011492_07240 [Flexivirga endophytica]GHB35780.1 hypothetical protein GCM10008112_00370 [Flexivirga endophytica]